MPEKSDKRKAGKEQRKGKEKKKVCKLPGLIWFDVVY